MQIAITHERPLDQRDAIILAVAHDEFLSLDLNTLLKGGVYDVRDILPRHIIDGRR